MQGYQPSYRPDYSPWEPGAAGPGYESGAGGVPVKRSRPWLVAGVATLTMLVLIAGVANQTVTDTIQRHIVDNGRQTFTDYLLGAVLQFGWRFTPHDNDKAHAWAASLAFIGAALVLTLLLTAVLTRGRGGFGQLFLATWVAVVVATMLAAFVRATVIDQKATGVPYPDSRAAWIFFGTYSATAYVFACGLGFGLVAALVAAVVGVSARRTDLVGDPASGYVPAGPAYEPAGPEPARDQQQWAAPVPGPVSTSPWTADTEQQPRVGLDKPETQHTAVLPAVDRPADEHSSERRDRTSDITSDTTTDTPADDTPADDSTQALPRQDDDRR